MFEGVRFYFPSLLDFLSLCALRVLESRTAVRDNENKVERVEVRRQLGDRYTHVTRKRALDSGEEAVERRAHNIPEEVLLSLSLSF